MLNAFLVNEQKPCLEQQQEPWEAALGQGEHAEPEGTLQGADFIPLVPVPNLVQRLRGYAEGTACTSTFTALRTSEQAAFPRKRATQSPFPTPAQTARVPGTAFVYNNKAGAMATRCDVTGV